jgi:lipopolysaccharide/colanic/teichoic acid biosynthesis glycosyltransferase
MATTSSQTTMPLIEVPTLRVASCYDHVLHETLFRSALIRERKRSDRSGEALAVVLVTGAEGRDGSFAAAIASAKRGTDVVGWFNGQTLGVIMPEIRAADNELADDVRGRYRRAIADSLGSEAARAARIELYIHAALTAGRRDVDRLIKPSGRGAADRFGYDSAKRALDVITSLTMLLFLAPVFAIIALLVKLKSPGPVFFRQERVGHGMKPFSMLKFRTMHVDADHGLHHQFVSSFIKSGALAQDAGRNGMFKLANDPRVTPVGRILRKTSLDELPQLWNVLRGEMSLVGPRPPLRYEVDEYQLWHCRRVLEAKPGVTGLWQVKGRSRTTFDDMVRLDLRYAKARSFWTDIKILVATPAAVIAGKGAA